MQPGVNVDLCVQANALQVSACALAAMLQNAAGTTAARLLVSVASDAFDFTLVLLQASLGIHFVDQAACAA